MVEKEKLGFYMGVVGVISLILYFIFNNRSLILYFFPVKTLLFFISIVGLIVGFITYKQKGWKKSRSVIIMNGIVFILMILAAFNLLLPLNDVFPQNPDLFCKEDSDCRLIISPEMVEDCEPCGSCASTIIGDPRVIAINKDWRPFCPFPHNVQICPACTSFIEGYDDLFDRNDLSKMQSKAQCINNQCEKVLE